MTPLAILKLVGFATGAALHLYLGWLLLSRRQLSRVERVVLSLGLTVGGWHLGNFGATLYELLEMHSALWWLKAANVIAYSSLALLPPVGFHAQMRVWELMDSASAQHWLKKFLTRFIWLGYVPLLILPWVVVQLCRDPYLPPLERLSQLTLPFTTIPLMLAFMLWSVFVLWECAGLSLLIARRLRGARERRLFEIMSLVLAVQGMLNLLTYIFGARHWQMIGPYVEAIAMLGSIVPTAIIAYYIYRYRYLEIVIRQSLVYAVVAATVMMIYLFVIRRLSLSLEANYGLRSGVIEALLILALVFLAAPLRLLTEKYVKRLFVREVGIYRDLVARVGAAASGYSEMSQLIAFTQKLIADSLELSQVSVIPATEPQKEIAEICHQAEEQRLTQIEDGALLAQIPAQACYALWRETHIVGLLAIGGSAQELTAQKREVLSVLSGHIATAVANCQLLEEKLTLERALAERERLASLGQMAATVAHEIKNPLSAIKSIAQVMREDETVSREYGRDLDLIKGEIDRLSRSVSQLLSFSRPAVVAASAAPLGEVMENVISLARPEIQQRNLKVTTHLQLNPQLSGTTVTLLREILSNLLLNAVQAPGHPSRIEIVSEKNGDDRLSISVTDNGAGIPASLQKKIFEPFFTTRQRGTGLGLAIVARRVRDLEGEILVVSPIQNERGTRFTVRLSLSTANHPVAENRPQADNAEAAEMIAANSEAL
jgi:signal transduction histidine kinase